MANIVIMLDPGHGGGDPGAVGGGLRESDLVLQLCLYEAELWKARGVTPLLTRTTDKYVSLAARTAQENTQKPACIISHHLDAAVNDDGTVNKDACGATVWLHSKAPASYVKWGQDVIAGLRAAGLTSNRSVEVNKGFRGNPNQNYGINRDTVSPSMLVEFGFITSPVNRAEFQKNYKAYAKAVVDATAKFLGLPEIDNMEAVKAERDAAIKRAEAAENKLAKIKLAGGW